MVPALAGSRSEILAPGEIEDLPARAGQRPGGGGEFSFVLVIHRHRLAQHQHGLAARHPVEVRVQEQMVIALEGGRSWTVTST